MSDPLAIAAAERHLRTAEAEITTALEQLGIHQYHTALDDRPHLQEAIVHGQEALMSLERALGEVAVATGIIDEALEVTRPRDERLLMVELV